MSTRRCRKAADAEVGVGWKVPRSPAQQGTLWRRIAPDHGRGKPSRCLSTTPHLWQTLGFFFRKSIFLTEYAQPASPSALQRVKPPIPAKISPVGRTAEVEATSCHLHNIAHLPYFLGAPTSEKEYQLFEKLPNSWKNLILTISDHSPPVQTRSLELRDREHCASEGEHAAARLINTLSEQLLGFQRLDVVLLGLVLHVERGKKGEVGKQALHRNERMADVLVLRGTRVVTEAGQLPWHQTLLAWGEE